MTRIKLGLLGLCAVVFGLMAFSTTAAQAEVNSHFWITAGKTDAGSLNAKVDLEVDVAGVLHTEISKTAVLFLCSAIAAENALLEGGGKIGEGAKIRFSGCSTDLKGTPSAACEPVAGGTEKGVIRTALGHGLVKLSPTGSDVIQILPDNTGPKKETVSETFATIEMSKECAIGSKVPVIGKAVIKAATKAEGRELIVKHLVEIGSKAEGTELWTISKTTEHEAFILGSAKAFLIGTHSTVPFGAEPA